MGYIGVITHLLTIDPNFLAHPSGFPSSESPFPQPTPPFSGASHEFLRVGPLSPKGKRDLIDPIDVVQHLLHQHSICFFDSSTMAKKKLFFGQASVFYLNWLVLNPRRIAHLLVI